MDDLNQKKRYSMMNPVQNIQNNFVEVESNASSHEPFNEEINFYSELYKITMNEIESRRKKHVQNVLKMKFDSWEIKRREQTQLNITKKLDKESIHLLCERLAIDKNYRKNLDNYDGQFLTRLHEENIIDEKKRSLTFTLLLNNTCHFLNNIKLIFNEFQLMPQFLNNQMNRYMLFEDELNKFKNVSQNADDRSILNLDKLLQNIQSFYEELVLSVSQKTQFEKDLLKADLHNNNELKDNIKIRKNKYELKICHKSKETQNEIQNFPFKPVENPVILPPEILTFKFNDKSNISDFPSSIDNKSSKEIKDSVCYNFEDDYNKFLENHLALQNYLEDIKKSFSSFLLDDFKSLRRELIKPIHLSVNCISSMTPWHMEDKFNKLDALLKSKSVKTGNSIVSANSPGALTFCKYTLAEKIVNYGENVADVKIKAAFEVASIVTELWQVHPDFGLMLYATFKQKCPCLIPYNFAQTNAQTDEEYYKSLGYSYTNGVVEKQDKFLNRMTGIIRLFAAIIVTETKSGKALDIGIAWVLISATVNLAPQLDVTAIFLHEVLLITGYHLKKAYGRQFDKMLKYIDTNYMKKIDEITPTTCVGPVQRLKTFISKAIKVGYIEKSNYLIPFNYW